MKKVLLGLLALCCSYAVMAQTVSASSVTFRYCETTYGSETKAIAFNEFPYTWNNIVIGEPGTYVTTITNARGCDSIVTLTIAGFHGFQVALNTYVQFAKGNLQYQPSSQTWRIAPNAWTYTGKKSVNYSPSAGDSDWKDLFAWGTGDNPLHCYQNDQNASNYAWHEWGANIIDTYPAYFWQTPTQSQLNYLIEKRPNASSMYLKSAVVNDVKGMIFLPDDWDRSGWSWQNPYTAETWAEMEAKGAIFLPYAGTERSGTMSNVGSDFGLWTSTTGGGTSTAKYMSSWPQTAEQDRYCGVCVRLIHYSDK